MKIKKTIKIFLVSLFIVFSGLIFYRPNKVYASNDLILNYTHFVPTENDLFPTKTLVNLNNTSWRVDLVFSAPIDRFVVYFSEFVPDYYFTSWNVSKNKLSQLSSQDLDFMQGVTFGEADSSQFLSYGFVSSTALTEYSIYFTGDIQDFDIDGVINLIRIFDGSFSQFFQTQQTIINSSILRDSYTQGFENAYSLYFNARYELGYNTGYDDGYNLGIVENDGYGFKTLLTTVFSGLGAFLSISLLPGITFGMIIAVPVVFGIIFFILGRRKE